MRFLSTHVPSFSVIFYPLPIASFTLPSKVSLISSHPLKMSTQSVSSHEPSGWRMLNSHLPNGTQFYFFLFKTYFTAPGEKRWLFNHLLWLTWVFEECCHSGFGDCHISCSGEQIDEYEGGVGKSLSEQLCSQLSGQSVNYYLKTILLFVSSDLEEKFHGLRTEWVYWLIVISFAMLFGNGRGQLLAVGRPKGESAREVTNAPICLN